jgi:2-succinyl-5-enolpyruvyl-6-hydroxy-3-cyclohexene-1-carboxylate synthase
VTPDASAPPSDSRAGPDDVNVQATFAATLVDEWVRAGLSDAVVCPGSRSTPLVLALHRRSEVRLHVRLDERSAGFYCLGLALASGRPALVCTTSGTAAAEVHPAVVEAHHSGVPMLVCTADRPEELQDVGAPQTVDQVHLFGRAVRWFAAPGSPHPAGRPGWRPLAARAYAEAVGGPRGPGPVHLNLAFREPLIGPVGDLPPARTARDAGPRVVAATGHARVAEGWLRGRGVIVAGAGCGPVESVLGFAGALGWPVIADPRSGCRIARSGVIAAADGFLRQPEVRRALQPDTVVVLGALPVSRAIGGWLAEAATSGAEIVAVDPWWQWRDPDRVVTRVVHDQPEPWLDAVRRATDGPAEGAWATSGGWLARWTAVEDAAQTAIDQCLKAELAELGWDPRADSPADGPGGLQGGGVSEPGLARVLWSAIPSGTRVVVSSSMPVRDLESFAPKLDRQPMTFANRGANGIDGVASTALGVAAAGDDPVVCLLGDLAFLHDVSALVRTAGASAARGTCTLVVADNDGGGIFSFLPQAEALAEGPFDLLFGTPHLPRVLDVAAGFGLPVREVGSHAQLVDALRDLVGRVDLAVVRVAVPSRVDNVAVHGWVFDAVGRAGSAALATT